MSKKITKIDIIFENTDYVTIPKDCINALELYGISNSLSYTGYNDITLEQKDISEVKIVLNEKAKSLKTLMQRDDSIPLDSNLFNEIKKRRDICALQLYYNDNSIDFLYTPWGFEEYVNTCEFESVKKIDDEKVLEIIIRS